ncbi:protein GAMETOPHYTE DEFECTIVE 1 [Prosopis cineraria]|uniref:protein GAMETOPHYTE DEFECTIVE 1 n=1 Tax=Prosopis cineraria TaxID=364024 RepID=UPI0024100557|nr:protein GAMETOPHYTE DEFECTIVE 1 [Prosopis cineraria]XP_054800048.1 protein GAMETOPHYTE DEFECTIVE 1 [Prosopis cineraria]XP_054800049.1 protein GAMETOPHYTE DEFECTIVE 1 [Prosopis cineraria]XP_054800051.1 protein GAMETOPHYTE DEFECTIVE 1 [Prosopis cineraria]XP_054800052.1 protein GAMETOPHYTE DEFECTIVE 1 [Prosopis cineraria]
MGFFDLNVPYLERLPTDKATLERQRIKIVVKAMELGYTGIAYNRTIKGVMSDSHRCCIPLLTLSSLLKVAPSLSLSVKLHRDLLGIPSAAPFRQYTRLTVCVENSLQAQALNSGNPILKTYDLVAIRPLNQTVFDQACERMEVDIISIDFSGKLPFRLKQPMVKAAVERGVCFEVIYSGLIMDTQIRRQLICNAKLLVDWTRGKNIILSSAAPSVNELRGPYDVANLSSLLGLSKEKAKAAISKNCRTLLTNSLRKKQYYKGAIKVEVGPSAAASKFEEAWHNELLKWDPISSGEGDLLLDDMAKSFSLSCKASRTTKAIDFASAIGSIPSHGFQVGDFLSAANSAPTFVDDNDNSLHVTEKVTPSTAVLNNPIEQSSTLDVCPESDKGLSDAPAIHHVSHCDSVTLKSCTNGSSGAFRVTKEIETPTSGTKLEFKCLNYIDENCTYLKEKTHEYASDKCITSIALDGIIPEEDEKLDTSSADAKLEGTHDIHGIAKMQETWPKEDIVIGERTALEMNQSICETSMADEQFKRHESEAIELGEMSQKTCHEVQMEDDCSIATQITANITMKDQKHVEGCIYSHQHGKVQSMPGRSRVKRGTTSGMHLSPFKRLLNPMPFKKKAQKIKTKTKMK